MVGAAGGEAQALLEGLPWVRVVQAQAGPWAWAPRCAPASTRSSPRPADCAVIGLVDTPDVGAEVVCRVLAAVGTAPAALGRAAYGGVPGHPVVLGREHWQGVGASASGDRGARDYLAAHPPRLVECGDLATGADIDVAS